MDGTQTYFTCADSAFVDGQEINQRTIVGTSIVPIEPSAFHDMHGDLQVLIVPGHAPSIIAPAHLRSMSPSELIVNAPRYENQTCSDKNHAVLAMDPAQAVSLAEHMRPKYSGHQNQQAHSAYITQRAQTTPAALNLRPRW